jgi:hypothetical protein
VLKATCAWETTDSPLHSASAIPTTSATMLPVSGCRASCLPMIGKNPSAVSKTLSCSDGLPCSTNPSTVTMTSSSGKTEKNA